MKTRLSFAVVSFIMLYLVCSVFAQEWYPVNAGMRMWDADFRDVFFVGEQNGWIVGDQGKILHTENGGSWIEQESGVGTTLHAVYFINLTNGWAVGNYGVILSTEDGGKNWVLSQNDSGESLFDIFFLTENIGWIAGSNGAILYTEDGGNNWSKSSHGANDLYAMHFDNLENGWAVGKNGTVIHWDGNTWTEENSPVTSDLYGVYDKGSGNVWAVGENGAIIHKGGLNWSQVGTSSNVNLNGLSFVDNQYGWIAGDYATALYTNNSGSGWTKQKVSTTSHLKSIFAVSSSRAWAVGENGTIILTVDSGSSWVTPPSYGDFLDVCFPIGETLKGWIVGENGLILHTEDAGETWDAQASPTVKSLRGVYFLDGFNGWAVGESGTIVHTTDGFVWNLVMSSPNGRMLRSIHFSDLNNGWAVGDFGTILHWNGAMWEPQSAGTTQNLFGIQVIDGSTAWIAGDGGTILKTTDGGMKWEKVPSGTTMLLRSLRFYNSANALAAGNLGVIVRTLDGGETWNQVFNGGSYTLFDIDYISNTEAFVVGEQGLKKTLFGTTNGGDSWQTKAELPSNNTIQAIDFTSRDAGIAVGKNGTILRYTSNLPEVKVGLISPAGDSNTLTPTFKWTTTRPDITHTIYVDKNENPFITQALYRIPRLPLDNGTSYTLTKDIALSPGTYYWGIETVDGTRSEVLQFTAWSAEEIVIIAPAGYISESKPTFQWRWIANATYRLFIDNDANPFDSKNVDVGREMTYTISDSDVWKELPEGMYTWGVEGNDDGNITKSAVETFSIDLYPPKGTILINDGGDSTNSPIVVLKLSATDPLGEAATGGSGVVQMQLSNDGATWSNPERFIAPEMTKTWDLSEYGGSGEDGLYSVYVRYKDALDHWSEPIKADINLDSESPTGTISIDNGAEATGKYEVTLTFSASGVSEMILSNNGSDWTAPLTFESPRQWDLLNFPGGNRTEGIRTVYVKFRDKAGNWTDEPATDTIRLDRTGPKGTIVINGGEAETNSLIVTLTLSANDESEVKEMMLSNGGDIWSEKEPYKTIKENWDLSQYGGNSNDGLKKVYVRFIDSIGNQTQPAVEDSITFKSTVIISSLSISGPKVAQKMRNGDTIKVIGRAEQGVEISSKEVVNEKGETVGLDLSGISYNTNTGAIEGSFSVGTLTAKTVQLKVVVKDNVGNEAESISNALTVDNDPPSNTSITIDREGVVNSRTISAKLTATDAKEMYLDGDISGITSIEDGLKKWIGYQDSLTLTVTTTDGTKTIKAKFRDDMGNESAEVSDSIILDMTAPKGSISIDSGDALSGGLTVNLKLTATDKNSVNAYQLSNDGVTWSSQFVFPKDKETAEVKGWDLRQFGGNSTDGLRTVYVKYKDVPGNWSAAFSDSINIDATPPSISITPISDKREALNAVVVSAIVKDNTKIAEVSLHYRKKGTVEYTKATMVKLPGDWYSADIPAAEVTLAGIEYYLEASDGLSSSIWPDNDAPANPKAFTVVDTTPPEIKYDPIFEISVKESLKVNARITDAVGVDRVSLNYKIQSDRNYTKLSMKPNSEGDSDVYSATIPALDAPGVMDYYIEAYDTSSNLRTSPASGSRQPFVLTFVDVEPPSIVHKPISNGHEAGTPVTIGANITDNVGIDKVVFKYRPPNKSELVEVKMTNVGTYYSVEIAGDVLMPGKVDYIISASDASRQSEDAEVSYSFTVVDTIPPLIELVTAPSREEVHKDILIRAKITDNVLVTNVTFHYKNVMDTEFNSVVMRGVGSNYTVTITKQDQPGEVKYYILASDSQGLFATEPPVDPESVPHVITIYDASKPIIQHTPIVAQKEAGSAIAINATVTDDVKVDEVTLHYRLAGYDSFKIASMTETATKSVYTGSIPADQIMPTGVEYYIKAIDNSANVTTHPAVEPDKLPHSFRVVDTIPPDIIYDASKLTKIQLLDLINITANVADRTGIREVKVYYKVEGEADFSSLICNNLGDSRYSATIPSPLFQSMVYYYIQADDNSGNQSTSPKENPKGQPYSVFVEDRIAPDPPTRLAALPAPGGKVKLTWELSKSVDVGKYNVYTDGGSGDIDYSTVYNSVDASKDSWESTALGEGVYKFSVRAMDKSGNEEKNVIFVSVEADAIAPQPVTGVSAKSISNGRIELNWNLSLSRDVAVYNIYWDNAQAYMDYSNPLARVNDPGTKWVSEKLRDGIVYRFIVRCQDEAGNEDDNMNIVSARADSTPPSIVAVLSSSSHKMNVWSNEPEIQISWLSSQDVISGLAGYSVVWDSNEKTIPDETIDITDPTTTKLTYRSPDLEKLGFVRLYFHIRPVDKSGNWNSEASHFGAFMIDIGDPQPPIELSATPQPDGKIRVMWSKSESEDVSQYNVYWDNGTGNGVDYTKAIGVLSADNGGSTTYSWTTQSLTDGKTYEFSVRSVDQASNEEKNTKVVSAIADDQPPTIVHKPITAMLEQEIMSIDIHAEVDDSGGIDRVRLYYRKHGESKYLDKIMAYEPPNTYRSEIPSSVFSSAGVDYYISAVDKAGNTASYPVTTISIVKSLQVALDPTKENEILLGDGSSIYFPAGAVPFGTNVFITIPLVIPEPQEGLKSHIMAREFSLDKELLKPITVTLKYSDAKVIGEDESKLAMYIWNGERWNYLASVNADDNSAMVSTMNTGIFSITGDYEPPAIKELLPSGYAEPNDYISAKFDDNGSGISAKKIEITLNGGKIETPSLDDPKGDGSKGRSISISRSFGLGEYTLQVSVEDMVGNRATATSNFSVSGKLAMMDTYCYPNPFDPKIGVNFAYTLTESADSLKIRIFGMDGRLVKEIDGSTKIGKNDVKWDCNDEAGDQVLSSVYICYIEAKSSKSDVRQTIKIAGW